MSCIRQRCLNVFILTIILFQDFTISGAILPRVTRQVDGNGFHRNFIYHVSFDNLTHQNCFTSLYFELPSAVYINVDELADLRRTEDVQACSVGETDVELFMENAKTQNVTICTSINDPSSPVVLKLPLHQRYQYAKESGNYEQITLKKPKLLIGCKKRIREHRVSKIPLCSPCINAVLKWREIPYNMENEEYIWVLPVGNTSHSMYVTYITLLTTILGTAFMVKVICKSGTPKRHLKTN